MVQKEREPRRPYFEDSPSPESIRVSPPEPRRLRMAVSLLKALLAFVPFFTPSNITGVMMHPGFDDDWPNERGRSGSHSGRLGR